MRLGGKGPHQMTRQLELPLANRGEAPTGKRSEEAPTATHGNERSGASDLMEKACERRTGPELYGSARFYCHCDVVLL